MVTKAEKNYILIRCYLSAILFVGISIGTFAQVTATASASATIITPIAISKSVDMDFGNIAAGSSAGSVQLTPAGSRSLTGGITLPGIQGTVTPASFLISGAPNVAYSITLPVNALIITSGSNNMEVNVFESDPAATGTLGTNGLQTLNVGATLIVGASQPAGSYSSNSPFAVTVNYN